MSHPNTRPRMKKYKPVLILLLLALLGRMSLFEARTVDAQQTLAAAEAPATDTGATVNLDMAPNPSGCNGPLISMPGTIDDDSGRNISPVRFGTAPDLEWFYTIPELTFAAGSVALPQVVTWDAYLGRENTEVQPAERVRFEFFNQGTHVASTDFTADLADGVASAHAVTNLGSVNLPNGADEVRIVHYDWVTPTTTENSLVVTAACFEATAAAPPATAPPETAPPETAPPETVPPAPETDCNPETETPEPADGCAQPVPTCDEDPSATGCDQGPLVCDDDPATPEPAGGCTPTPVCDDDDTTPEPAEGCDEEVSTPPATQPPAPVTPDPGAGDGDQQPELAVTGSTTDRLLTIGLIFMILGVAFDGAIARAVTRVRTS